MRAKLTGVLPGTGQADGKEPRRAWIGLTDRPNRVLFEHWGGEQEVGEQQGVIALDSMSVTANGNT